ncbi:helix-turn-helix transcriptional regulator [Haemophilus influenzae]|nr:helix-turn-helix transcriptional regulator [Haemophilus influenzae]MCK9121690.1 helix-turn-helix transcriptional regulator [Haemophilus influenzae]
MRNAKEWFSANELKDLEGLPNSPQGINKRARTQNWIKREKDGVQGGAVEYHYSSLPLDVQRQLGFEQGQEVQKAPISETLNENVLMIDSFSSINVSAGFGSFNEGVTKPDEQTPYSAALLRKLGVNPKYAAVFWADGISMRPTIDDGDQMLVDLERKEIKGDKIYLVQNGSSVWVKRVKIRWDGVELISDNREEYPPIILSKDEAENLQVIGQLVHLGKNMI